MTLEQLRHLLDESSLQSLFPLSPFPHLEHQARPASRWRWLSGLVSVMCIGDSYLDSPRCKGLGDPPEK